MFPWQMNILKFRILLYNLWAFLVAELVKNPPANGKISFSFYDWLVFHCMFISSLVAQLVKNTPAMQETPVRFLGWEGPLEKKMAPHSSILAWKISWRGAWWAAVHGVAKSQAGLSD